MYQNVNILNIKSTSVRGKRKMKKNSTAKVFEI